MTTRLTSTKLIVDDLDAMAGFYTTVFGYENRRRIEAGIGDERIDEILLGSPGEPVDLILMAFPDRPPPPTDQVALVFSTDDLDGLVGRVTAAGGAVHVAPYDSQMPGVRASFVRDPEGTLIEVIHVAET